MFFSCEPGGAEVIVPVAKLLIETGEYDVIVTGYGHAIERFERHQIPYIVIDRVGRDDYALLQRFTPDLVITSATSIPAKDMSEKYIWLLAKEAGIKSIAMIDQWQNYSIRFSGTSGKERLAYLPDAINCIDQLGKIEMIEEGFDEDILYSLGHPYLDQLERDAKEVNSIQIRKKINISHSETVLLFVSEAIEENYGVERGYTQYDALRTLLKNSLALKDTSILIKLHPKDNIDKFQNIREEFKQHKLIFISSELTALEAIAISNVVFGMTSIMLIEAYILGKVVISIQPNLRINDPLVLSRHNYVSLITNDNFKLNIASESVPAVEKRLEYQFKQAEFMTLVNKFLRPLEFFKI